MSKSEPRPNKPLADSEEFARDILVAGITKASLDGEKALFDVLPGVGKSRSIPKLAKGTGMPITVLTNLRDNYEQYKRWGLKEGISVRKLPTRELCPTLRTENPAYLDDPDAQQARKARDMGWPVSAIHREFDCPCERAGETCPYRERVSQIDSDSPELLVGHYTQAYNPKYINGRVVVIDEQCFNDYIQQIKKPIEKSDEFITTIDDFPFDHVRRPEVGEEDKREEALRVLEEVGLDPQDHCDSIAEFDAKAPLVAYAIIAAERMSNGLCVAELPKGRTGVVDNPRQNSLWLFDPPAFENAEAVIALDATPCISNWSHLLGSNLRRYPLFNAEQRNRYLRDRGYEFNQLNGYVWAVSNGDVSLPKCEAYLREVYRKHGEQPDLITSKKLLKRLRDANLEHLWRRDLHYGDLRGKNDLKKSELLVVLGSPGRSDQDIQYQTAFHGECAEPATDKEGERLNGFDLDYQNEIANDILDTTRRGEVFQAAMRAGRADDAEATVYIATGMVPDWLETQRLGRKNPDGTFDACLNTRCEAEKNIIEALQGAEGIKASEIAEESGESKEVVKKHRQVLQERGLVEKDGERRWAEYHDRGLSDLNIAGDVSLEPIGKSPYNNLYKGELPIESAVNSRHNQIGDVFERLQRYPDWVPKTWRRARERWEDEQMKQRWVESNE